MYNGNYLDPISTKENNLKKSISAVFLAAFASAATAGTEVYGVADIAVRTTDGTTSMVSGSYHTSRLGFRSTEDLGNGVSASVTLEGKLDMVNGDMPGDQLFNREASVSIGSRTLGTITLGRTDTSDSEAIDSVAGFGNFGNFSLVSGLEYAGDREQTVRYTSPNLGGVTAKLGHSMATATDQALNSASVVYSGSGFSLAAGYDRTEGGDTYTAVGGSAQVAGLSVGAMYGQRDTGVKSDITVLTARVPVGSLNLHGAYSLAKSDTAADATTWAAGVSYDFSKRTSLVAVYKFHEDSADDFGQVGIRHSF